MALFKPFITGLAIAAAGSMAATPALAVDLPLPVGLTQAKLLPYQASDDDSTGYHRRYRYRRHRHIDGGDVLAGILILGGIAAIASASNKNNRDDRYRDRDYRDRDYRDRDYRDRDRRYDNTRGIDRAVDMCVREVERDARVDSVDEVERDGGGWEVKGTLYNGDSFQCEIGSDGRIKDLDYGDRSYASVAPIEDRQWDDDRYSQARARIDGRELPDDAVAPAYPGGPLPGEDIDGDLAQDDGRYSTADAPDFEEA